MQLAPSQSAKTTPSPCSFACAVFRCSLRFAWFEMGTESALKSSLKSHLASCTSFSLSLSCLLTLPQPLTFTGPKTEDLKSGPLGFSALEPPVFCHRLILPLTQGSQASWAAVSPQTDGHGETVCGIQGGFGSPLVVLLS